MPPSDVDGVQKTLDFRGFFLAIFDEGRDGFEALLVLGLLHEVDVPARIDSVATD